MRLRTLTPAILALCALTAGCGSTTSTGSAAASGSDTSSGAEQVEITVGVSPSTASVPMYLAAQEEFAEQGLKVDLVTIQSGAEAVPRLVNGELAFSLGDAAGTVTASTNGVPLAITGVAVVSPTEPEEDYSAVVASSPDITGPADLEGRTVAVNQLNGGAELTVRAAIDDQGGDSSKVEFVELAFPQMVDAVSKGRVDAAQVVEPFLSGATAAGLRTVIAPQAYGTPGLPSTIIVSSQQYAQQNPDVVERFDTAVGQAAARAVADPELARKTAASYTKIPPDVLATIILPLWAQDAGDVAPMEEFVALMDEYEFLEKQPDLSTLLVSP